MPELIYSNSQLLVIPVYFSNPQNNKLQITSNCSFGGPPAEALLRHHLVAFCSFIMHLYTYALQIYPNNFHTVMLSVLKKIFCVWWDIKENVKVLCEPYPLKYNKKSTGNGGKSFSGKLVHILLLFLFLNFYSLLTHSIHIMQTNLCRSPTHLHFLSRARRLHLFVCSSQMKWNDVRFHTNSFSYFPFCLLFDIVSLFKYIHTYDPKSTWLATCGESLRLNWMLYNYNYAQLH